MVPRNLFLLFWSVVGLLFLGYGLVNGFLAGGDFDFTRRLFLKIVWALAFMMYIL